LLCVEEFLFHDTLALFALSELFPKGAIRVQLLLQIVDFILVLRHHQELFDSVEDALGVDQVAALYEFFSRLAFGQHLFAC
jgi:hypothetical protein